MRAFACSRYRGTLPYVCFFVQSVVVLSRFGAASDARTHGHVLHDVALDVVLVALQTQDRLVLELRDRWTLLRCPVSESMDWSAATTLRQLVGAHLARVLLEELLRVRPERAFRRPERRVRAGVRVRVWRVGDFAGDVGDLLRRGVRLDARWCG